VTAERRTPPYRIRTERLVIRCWEPADAPLMKEVVDESVEHLRPWMPWAHDEPQTLAEKTALLGHFHDLFQTGRDFVYGIFSADESEVVGRTGLHTRLDDDAFEIGYWIRAGRVGRGLATEAAAALTRVAFAACGVDRMEIHVDPANEVSCRIPRRLGYVEEGTLRRRLPPMSPGAPRRDLVAFSMLTEEFAASPLAATPLEAYDVDGARVL
jgi:RimJ/RimL family protein N-acetyltransferase